MNPSLDLDYGDIELPLYIKVLEKDKKKLICGRHENPRAGNENRIRRPIGFQRNAEETPYSEWRTKLGYNAIRARNDLMLKEMNLLVKLADEEEEVKLLKETVNRT
jgi:hypothetical protein